MQHRRDLRDEAELAEQVLVRDVEAQQRADYGERVLDDDATLDAVLRVNDVERLLERSRECNDLLEVRVTLQQRREEEQALIAKHLTRTASHRARTDTRTRVQHRENTIDSRWGCRQDIRLGMRWAGRQELR